MINELIQQIKTNLFSLMIKDYEKIMMEDKPAQPSRPTPPPPDKPREQLNDPYKTRTKVPDVPPLIKPRRE
jgi:hypothetical protein